MKTFADLQAAIDTVDGECRDLHACRYPKPVGLCPATGPHSDTLGPLLPLTGSADGQGTTHRLWRGEDLAGKSIIVTAEQGAGDTIQFLRYLDLLADRAAEVTLMAPQRLHALLRAGRERVSFIADRIAVLPQSDFYVSLMSLPGLFKTSLESIPAVIPYLEASPALVEAWKTRGGGGGGGGGPGGGRGWVGVGCA